MLTEQLPSNINKVTKTMQEEHISSNRVYCTTYFIIFTLHFRQFGHYHLADFLRTKLDH